MDVQCERCKTEYEFDDALVSGRGTTVKCTNCGHQFKIRPAGAGAGLEQWSVKTVAGQSLVFTTLRELQKAIANGQVGRGDTLSRGNAPPRPLGAIAELEPFFNDRAGAGRAGGAAFPPPAVAARVPPQVAPPTVPVLPAPPPRVRERTNTLRPDQTAAVPPPPPAPVPNEVPTRAVPLASSPLPPPANPAYRPFPSYDDSSSSRGRAVLPSMPPDDSEMVYAAPRRRRVGGWIVATVVLGGACVLGYYAFRPYLSGAMNRTTAAPAALDPRAAQFLTDGERALSEANLDVAKENFDKASALADKDPHVLLDAARLAAVRADIPWLRTRLLPPDATDEIATTRVTLDDLGAAARKASDEALVASPDDSAAVRTKIDALRIVGERDAARSLVSKIIASAGQPETAYVLAALDLAELDPLWPTVIDRLRVAAAGEGNSGRARAALVYALARAGDAAGAKAELDKLASLAHPYPLLGALRAFLSKTPQKTQVDAGTPASTKPAGAAGAADAVSAPVAPVAGGASGLSGDPRVLLQQAEAAKNRGDYERAKVLYDASLTRSPGDSQALSGLGDVARARHDSGSAKGFYQRALATNPNYLPALVGLGDVEWEEGDQPRAQKAYKDIEDRFPDGTYPARVKQRAEASTPSPAAAPPGTAAPATKPAASSAPLTLPANTPSDLPGSAP